MDWQPSFSMDMLRYRARYIQSIRDFFQEKNVIEVMTPLLSPHTITDPHIASIEVPIARDTYYLQSSPEFHMKRLLAAGSGAIYQIGHAFRSDERGVRHNPEFSMLEWYQPGYDHHQLMDEMAELLQAVFNVSHTTRITYQNLFKQYFDCDVLNATAEQCLQLVKKQGIVVDALESFDKDELLDLLMTHCIEKKLGHDMPIFVCNYPASQAALARTSLEDPRVAERFELYWHGLELANGFHELTSSRVQRQRFEADNEYRQQHGLPTLPLDEAFLACLDHMPACAGVALGIERLLMVVTDSSHIESVMAFSMDRA